MHMQVRVNFMNTVITFQIKAHTNNSIVRQLTSLPHAPRVQRSERERDARPAPSGASPLPRAAAFSLFFLSSVSSVSSVCVRARARVCVQCSL